MDSVDNTPLKNKGVDSIWDLEFLCEWACSLGLHSLYSIDKGISKNEEVDVSLLYRNDHGAYDKRYIGDRDSFDKFTDEINTYRC